MEISRQNGTQHVKQIAFYIYLCFISKYLSSKNVWFYHSGDIEEKIISKN